MKKLRDYSVEFDPNIRFEHFSRDTLVELLKVYSRLYLAVGEFWFLSVMERISHDEAMSCDLWVWEKQVKYEMDRLTKLLKIGGNDVVALFKALQFSPWYWNLEYKMEIKDRGYGVLTVTYCPVLAAMEREGRGREEAICRQLEPLMMKKFADYFNPDIEAKPLKLPPRKSEDEICCQWEFRLS
jgi:hypothetical protein